MGVYLMKRFLSVLPLLLAMATMIYATFGNAQKNSPPALQKDDRQKTLISDPFLPVAPNFELKSLNGSTVRLSDYRGKAVLLNFWATWCVPCKTEMPWLEQMQQKYGPQGLEVIGIAMDDSPGAVRKFVEDMHVNYIMLLGTQIVGRLYGGPLGLPTTFFIDRTGKITDQNTGLSSRTQIENEIKLALINGVPLSKAK